MLFLGVSGSIAPAVISWLDAIETSYRVGSPEGPRLWGMVILESEAGSGAIGLDWTDSGRLKFIELLCCASPSAASSVKLSSLSLSLSSSSNRIRPFAGAPPGSSTKNE
jgi:hypothetical protein